MTVSAEQPLSLFVVFDDRLCNRYCLTVEVVGDDEEVDKSDMEATDSAPASASASASIASEAVHTHGSASEGTAAEDKVQQAQQRAGAESTAAIVLTSEATDAVQEEANK